MKQIFTVFGYTFREAARKKTFIISTVIIALLIIVLSAVLGVLSRDSDGGGTVQDFSETTCYYIDDSVLIPGGAEAVKAALPGINLSEKPAAQYEAIKNSLDDQNSAMIVLISGTAEQPVINISLYSFMNTSPTSTVTEALNDRYILNKLAKSGVSEQDASVLKTVLAVSYDYVSDINIAGYATGIIMLMLIFFAIYYYGYGVAMSVATEKAGRVMETLIVSAKPSRVLIGKCLAMGALGLLQFTGIIAFASLMITLMVPDGITLAGMPVSFSAFTPYTAAVIIVYFVLGYMLYSLLNAVCGASVNKIEDLNSAMMPVMFIAMAGFYFGYISAAMGGSGTVVKAAMYLPLSSPFIIPFRLLNGGVAASDLAISVAAMVVAIVLVAFASVKIYSASVLHYGKRRFLGSFFSKKD